MSTDEETPRHYSANDMLAEKREMEDHLRDAHRIIRHADRKLREVLSPVDPFWFRWGAELEGMPENQEGETAEAKVSNDPRPGQVWKRHENGKEYELISFNSNVLESRWVLREVVSDVDGETADLTMVRPPVYREADGPGPRFGFARDTR